MICMSTKLEQKHRGNNTKREAVFFQRFENKKLEANSYDGHRFIEVTIFVDKL